MCGELTQDEILEAELKNEHYGNCFDEQFDNPIERLEEIIDGFNIKL